MSQHHKNFAYSTILTAPSPASSGTTIDVQAGDGGKFPDTPFQATIWPAGAQPISTNAEIVTVTSYTGDDGFTITRAQEGTSARSIIVGDQIAATITAQTLTEAESPLPFWSPFILASGAASGLQTLASTKSQSTAHSMLMFPVTVPSNIQFAEVVLVNSLSEVTSNNATQATNTFVSKYGLYSLDANTFNLISSSFFSIRETYNASGLSWNYPTSTATSGYGYGGFPAGSLTTTAQMASYINSLRSVGLQFGGNVSLSGGVYWLGLLSLQTTAGNTNVGLSHLGIIGQPINAINQAGTVNGLNPIGFAASAWSNNDTHLTQWWGRHIAGFITATSITNFSGTAIPSTVNISALGAVAANSTVTILPSVTFVST